MKTCLPSSPHVWYLTLGLLSLSYLAVAELVVIGLVIFLIGPILFIGLNVVLFVLGRHPLQNPLGITPPVGKLSRSTVERIPLVMYIPAPPDDEEKDENGVQLPPTAHAYPPQNGNSSIKKKRRFRFALLRRRKAKKVVAAGTDKHIDDGTEPASWEENWLASELPFVRLASNRASCAICLMDFAEPPRAKGSKLPLPGVPASEQGGITVGTVEPETEHRVQGEVDVSVDVSEEAEPLRLLQCGHTFHVRPPWICFLQFSPVAENMPRSMADRRLGSLSHVSEGCGRFRQAKAEAKVVDTSPAAKSGRRGRCSLTENACEWFGLLLVYL